MPDPMSLKSVATMVCMRVLLLENPTGEDGQKDVITEVAGTQIRPYITTLLETNCFTAVTEEILYRIVKFCPEQLSDSLLHALTPLHVHDLNLKDCQNVHLMGLVELFKKCCHVHRINLSDCSQLIHPDIFAFTGLFEIPLTTVIVESNSNVTDEVVHALLTYLPSLKTLSIASCGNISDKVFLIDSMEQLKKEFSPMPFTEEDCLFNLTSVDISGCNQLSSDAIKHLVSLCGPKLTDVNISYTSMICVALLHLGGYSLPAILDFLLTDDALKSDKELKEVLQGFRELRDLYLETIIEMDEIHKKHTEGDTVDDQKDIGDSAGETNERDASKMTIAEYNVVTEAFVQDKLKDECCSGNTGVLENISNERETVCKAETDLTKKTCNEVHHIECITNNTVDLIPNTNNEEMIEAGGDNLVEMFDKTVTVEESACGGEVCEGLDINKENETKDRDSKDNKNVELPVRTEKYFKGNVEVSKEVYYWNYRFDEEEVDIGNFEEELQLAIQNSILEKQMDRKDKKDIISKEKAAPGPDSSDKLNIVYSTLLYQPKIVKLRINGMKYVSRRPNLGQLCLAKFLAVNRGLQKFSINWKGLTLDFFKQIVPNLSELIEVELEECSMLTSGGVAALGRTCRKCKSVNLRGVVFISDSALIPFLLNKNLQDLSLAESDHITDKILIKISEHLNTSLRNLDLSWCEEITEKGINAICSTCKQLERLQLRKCPVSDFSLRLLAETGPDLIEISVESADTYGEDGLTDEGILTIANTFTNLRIIDISWNLAITDVSVSGIMMNCSFLEEANMKGLKRITIQPFLPIISDFEAGQPSDHKTRSTVYAPNLRVLDLDYSDLVNDTLLQEIVNVCRGTIQITDYYGQQLEAENI